MPARKGQSLDGAIDAATWNKVESFFGAESSQKGNGRSDPLSRTHIIKIKNGSGSDLGRGEILSWSDVLFDTTETELWRRPVLDGKTPEFPEDHGRIAVLQEAILDDTIGYAAIGGITPAKVNIAVASHPFAFLIDGSTASLKSGTSGHAAILHVAGGGTGVKDCLVHLGRVQPLWIVEEGSPTAGEGNLLGMDNEDSGVDVIPLDPLSMFADLEEDDKSFVQMVGPDFYYVQAPCT